MTGIICGWHGAIVDIPDGWVLCDGNNGTPDLRNQFIIGAGGSYAVGASGGGAGHNHNFTGVGHQHDFQTIAGTLGAAGILLALNHTNTSYAVGTTNNTLSLPPYYALAFIMKT